MGQCEGKLHKDVLISVWRAFKYLLGTDFKSDKGVRQFA